MNIYLLIRMRIRDQKKHNTIVKSAIRLINRLGFSGISIAKIARAAKVSPATIYIYFKNKEDFFTKIYIDIIEKMHDAALQGVDESKTIEQQFKMIWINFFTYSNTNQDFVNYREHFEQTLMMKKIRAEDFKLNKYITKLFQKGIEEKIIKNLPLPFLVAFSLIPIITLLKFNFEGTIDMDDDLINQASEIAWNILKSNKEISD